MKRLEIDLNMEKIPETIEYIRAALIKRRVAKKEITRTLLTAEDVLAKMMATAPEETQVWVSVGGLFGNVEIRLSAWGEPFDSSNIEENLLLGSGVEDEEANDVIRRMINKLYSDKLRIVNEHGYNRAIIRAKTSQFHSLILTLLALVGGVAVGLLMHNYLPAGISKGFSKNLFTPVYTMFMNALKMIVAPLVFCSVASSIADFGDLKALGKIAGKIVVFYLFTSMIAICVGFATYQIFPIGDPSLAGAVTDAAASTIAKGANATISIKDTIVGIIPNNIITPFQKSDMLQIIFMAV
ncbi:MAG: dicarboxylate/amino acid:cation symporter, partial [Spirochaetia bacterium]|nr:dicarboxylate/amino acid:cation symporter [Spirochaetia bacterium]